MDPQVRGSMANNRQSKCLGCGGIFTVDVRNRGRQKYCAKRPCRAAGKAARQRRWLGKPGNQDYFSGPEHVERGRTWRAAHPEYWRVIADISLAVVGVQGDIWALEHQQQSGA